MFGQTFFGNWKYGVSLRRWEVPVQWTVVIDNSIPYLTQLHLFLV